MKSGKLFFVSAMVALLLTAAPARAQTDPSCTMPDIARRILPIMRQYLMQQYWSARSLLTQIAEAGAGRERVKSYADRQMRRLELRMGRALETFERLPKDTWYCTDPSCYNVSLQEQINDFRLASGRILELHQAVGFRYATLIGSTAAAVGEQAQRNFMMVMEATDYYPMMTMVCPNVP